MTTRGLDVRVDVTGQIDLEGRLETAATVYVPDRIDGPLTVMVGYPGGGYSRGYYDIRRLPGYSQADYHTGQGFAFVACDHLGIGDSTPIDSYSLTLERMAAANHATASTILERLRTGSLAEGVPPVEVDQAIGMGQSMGGCLLTVQQGRHGTFDGVAILGYGLRSSFPAPDGSRMTFAAPARGSDLRAAEQTLAAVAEHGDVHRFAFHFADEEPELPEADMVATPARIDDAGRERAPWRAGRAPACAAMMMGEGAVAEEAAAIDVPVLIGCGEIDLVTDPWAEPAWYRGSRDVAVFVVPRMAHMHNFARTRHTLWDRIAGFAQSVSRRSDLVGR